MSEDWAKHVNEQLKNKYLSCKADKGSDHEYIIDSDPYKHIKKYVTDTDNDPTNEDIINELNKYLKGKHNCTQKISIPKKDKSKRYFENVFNKSHCEKIKGYWDYGSINRANEISKGICWTNLNNAYCGEKLNEKFINLKNNYTNPNIKNCSNKHTHCVLEI